MAVLSRVLRADFIKMKHTIFFWIHVAMPIIGIALFLSYYSFSKLDSINKVLGYIQVLSISFPLLISIVCSSVVEQEALAGNFKELLSTEYGRRKALISKVCLLLICGFCSTMLAVVGFATGFHFLLGQNEIPFALYVEISFILFSCQIFMYIWHLFLNFRFSKGASIGIGIIESLLAALMLTGMGDVIWKYTPCAWSMRLCNYFLEYKLSPSSIRALPVEAATGAVICVCFTIVAFVISLMWFSFYEGRKEM
ncbi:TPA: lantibiotic immunity ABC transporter MutG family permease subunit [Bacillus anthracis]|uniref:lantibiotic immunity ABC transporter MutG family permease subunit n=2 Tax=Bacillus anthracis TaxID=1392 RepID=UPI000164C815|nr:lantibiotic immunity ABC transporter MutG family permease subunit [Bacillus anthracis]AHK39873.1 Bacteriocin ABC transporter, permease protein subunit [Bacillus anthracis str. SVA11]AIF57899.1 multidrug ABC transporter permease [Bacillus anthracis]AJH37736.1 lantibiotic protection ABC transporter permease subunit, MutG family protein [Bacillus anthracis]AJH58744.1 lantibiotic protection ABC transporter permease subunit, MutG family protein [Bacillus anthracis]APT27219.1 multidrug ABC transp